MIQLFFQYYRKRQIMNKSVLKNTSKRTKKASEVLSKCHYFQECLLSQLFSDREIGRSSSQIKLKTAYSTNSMTYFYAQSQYDDIPSVQSSVLVSALEKNYSQNNVVHIGSNFQVKNTFKMPYLPVYGTSSEIIHLDIVHLESGHGKNKVKQMQLEVKPKDFQHYIISVIHYRIPQESTIEWEIFVETYEMCYQTLKYKIVVSTHNNESYLSFGKNQSFVKNLIELYANSQRLKSIIGTIHHIYQLNLQICEKVQDPAFGDIHKRTLRFPSEHYHQFKNLKKKWGHFFKDNDICRYLQAKKYNQKQVGQSMKQYVEWRTQFAKKYNSFKQFRYFVDAKIFYYLGEDYDGRPVILNKAANVNVDEFDQQKYCEFYMYFLEIFIVSKMRGNVDQVFILADVGNLGMKNFKFAITKRNIADGLKYCLQRQYKFIGFNVSSFAEFSWKFIKPLLPQNTLNKISVLGSDQKQIIEYLSKLMPISILPTYIGGENNIQDPQKLAYLYS